MLKLHICIVLLHKVHAYCKCLVRKKWLGYSGATARIHFFSGALQFLNADSHTPQRDLRGDPSGA